MEMRRFGRLGARVSALGFGGAPAGLTNYLGRWEAAAEESRASVTRAVRRALDEGITYFDTAPGYGGGLSEEIIGGALGADRARVFLATKTSRANWTPAGIRSELEASLRRLGTDHVDLLQFHGGWYSAEDAAAILEGDGLATYGRLREEGKVGALGFTAEGPNGAVERLIASGGFDAMMISYNLCAQAAGGYRNRLLPPQTVLSLAKARDMAVVTMRTLTSGVFQRWLARVAPAAVAPIDWNAALLDLVLSHPQIDVALVGMRTPAEVERNAASVRAGTFRFDPADIHDGYGGL
jgi:uncharacterized protein